MKLNRFIFGASCLLLLTLGLWLPGATLAAPAGLPSRATPTPAPAHHRFQGGTIILNVTTLRADLWAVVQWQDGLGQWHDVDGWRSPLGECGLAECQQVWAVYPEHLGLGPFRWMVYSDPSGQLYAYSEAFYLPERPGDIVVVGVPEPGATPTATPHH